VRLTLLSVSCCRNHTLRRTASTKPYRTFEEFYPFYLTEHDNKANRLLHFVYGSCEILRLYLIVVGLVVFLATIYPLHRGTSIVVAILYQSPLVIISILLAGAVGVVLTTLLQGLTHGLVEAGIYFSFFLKNEQFPWQLLTCSASVIVFSILLGTNICLKQGARLVSH
jgi:hypothetical protein